MNFNLPINLTYKLLTPKKMEKMKKKSESKRVNQEERIVFKKYFIQKEFEKVLKNIFNSESDEGLYVFIKMNMSFKLIEDFSEFGNDLIDMDFTDYLTGTKCFLCFINFDFDDFLDFMYDFYHDELND